MYLLTQVPCAIPPHTHYQNVMFASVLTCQALESAQRVAEQQRSAAWSYQQQGKEREAELLKHVTSLEEEQAALRRK